MSERGNRPSAVTLQLRQEAKFGCCRCGNAILVYHHIVPWEAEHHYRSEDMMAVCPTCHSAMKAIPREEQYRMKNEPYNLREGRPNGQLIHYSDSMCIRAGGNVFRNNPRILATNDEEVITLNKNSEGQASLSAKLYDSTGRLLAQIINNDWAANHENLPWDIECSWQYLKIRQGERNIALEIDMRQDVIELKGNLWTRRGTHLKILPSQCTINGFTFVGTLFESNDCIFYCYEAQ